MFRYSVEKSFCVPAIVTMSRSEIEELLWITRDMNFAMVKQRLYSDKIAKPYEITDADGKKSVVYSILEPRLLLTACLVVDGVRHGCSDLKCFQFLSSECEEFTVKTKTTPVALAPTPTQ